MLEFVEKLAGKRLSLHTHLFQVVERHSKLGRIDRIKLHKDTRQQPCGIITYDDSCIYILGRPDQDDQVLWSDTPPSYLHQLRGDPETAEAWMDRIGGNWKLAERENVFTRRQKFSSTPDVEGEDRRIAREKDLPVITQMTVAFLIEAGLAEDTTPLPNLSSTIKSGRFFILSQEESIVSMLAIVAQISQGVRISLVYTLPQERLHGYSGRLLNWCVNQILSGNQIFCCLHALESIPLEKSIYQRIGFKREGRSYLWQRA